MSLSERMQERAAELQREQTEKFDLPGWRDMLAVELKPLGFTTIRNLQRKNERERNETTREVYNMADQIIAATVGFHEVDGSKETPIEDTWVTLAKRLPDCPDGATPRQALLFLLDGDKWVHFLYIKWMEWASTVQPEVEKEVEQDFAQTG